MKKIYTVLTADGSLYAALHGEFDFFITPAHLSIEPAAAAFGWMNDFAWENATQHVLDMRPAALDHMECLVADLEEGHPLSDKEAFFLNQMYDFLHATVAPHQRTFEPLSDEVLECWARELGLRTDETKDWDVDSIVGDCALWPAVHAPCLDMRYPGNGLSAKVKVPKPSKEQNILAGRYLRSLANVSKLFGPKRMTPGEIIAEWSPKNCEYADGRPSLLGQVAELLTAGGWNVKRDVQI